MPLDVAGIRDGSKELWLLQLPKPVSMGCGVSKQGATCAVVALKDSAPCQVLPCSGRASDCSVVCAMYPMSLAH